MNKEMTELLKQTWGQLPSRDHVFLLCPNGGEGILFLSKLEADRDARKLKVRCSQYRQDVDDDTRIFVGDVRWENGKAVFHVDFEASKGNVTAAEVRKTLQEIGRQ